MSVIVDRDTRLCVSGITGREGRFHTLNNRTYGTNGEEGRALLVAAELPNVHAAATMDEAAARAVELARSGGPR